MPDGFSFRVSFAQAGEAFSCSTRMGDAAGIAAGDASITVGRWGEHDLRHERPGLVGSLIGKVIGRALAHHIGEAQIREMMREAATASPVLSGLLHPGPPDAGLYVPDPGREPASAEVIADPDLAERMPWLAERPRPSELPPGMSRSAMRTVSFDARLEDDDGTVIVGAFSGRIGRLSSADAEAYLPHLRSARAQGKVAAAMASSRTCGRRSLHVTIRLERAPGLS
jgi:hypothetical protein